MATTENFIESFHTLDGTTIDEKERSFRKLIHKNISLLQDQKWNENIVKKVTPRTYLESLFKVDLLITCRRTEELLEILIGGNEVQIKRIIKHGWFIHEVFQNMNAQDITDNLLPQLSYSIRMKILKKLSIHLGDEDKLYELFDIVKNKYGTNVAVPLIVGCSEARLESIIKNNPIFFTPTQLRHFIRKTPKLLPIYVEEYMKHKDNCDFLKDRDLMRYIASIDYNLYHNLHKKYDIKILHGRRATRKIFERQKNDILKKPIEYKDMFQKSAFMRKLFAYGSFKKYFMELLPKRINFFSYSKYSEMECCLKYVPKSKQFQLLEECFEETYKVQICDCPQRISTDILDIIPDSKKRQDIVNKMMNLEDNFLYVVYQETANSVPFLKKEIDLAANNLYRRKDLINALVKTCKINEEFNTLKEIMKYLTSRHRNDTQILGAFFNDLKENYDFHIFDKDIWELLIQLTDIFLAKDGLKTSYCYYIDDIYLTYSEFLFNESGEFPEEPLLKSMKNGYSSFYVIFSHTCGNPKFIRSAILKAIILLPKVVKKENLNDNYCNFASKIISWNQDHKDYAISINDHPILIESLKNQSGEYGFCDISTLFCTKDRSNDTLELLDIYWNKSSSFNEKTILYYLKWYPNTFLNNIKSSVNGLLILYCCGDGDKIFRMINKYGHINLPQNMINCIQEKLVNIKDNDECDDNEIPINSRTFALLARLMHPNDYIGYISKYKPEKLIIDMANDDEKELYKVQCYTVENLKYLSSPTAIPHILEYCGGDFLAHVLAALYKILYRTPENKLLPFIKQIMNNSVSVRKHSATLGIHLLDLNCIENILKTLLTLEQNSSLLKRFRMTAFKLFLHNPSDNFWNLFKCSLAKIDKTDKDSFELLVNMPYSPIQYRSSYFEEIWHLIDNSNLVEAQKYTLRNSLCLKMTSNINYLSLNMSLEVINTLFMKFSNMITYDGSVINKFVCEFLYQNQQAEKFCQICEILSTAKNSSFEVPQSETDISEEICQYINYFCDYVVANNSRNWNIDLAKDFLQQLCTLYPHIEYFPEYIFASSISILLDLQCDNVKLYASKVSSFIRNIVDIYGPYVVDTVVCSVVRSLRFFTQSDDYTNVKIEFIKEILKSDTSELSYKIALEIILTCDSDFCEFKSVLNIIQSCEYPSIQILLRQKSLYSKSIQ